MSGHRDIIIYGSLPNPVYVLRMPAKGVRWLVLMRAARDLVKLLTNTPKHRAAPDWYIDGDAPPWETTKQPRYLYSIERGCFEPVAPNQETS